MLERALTAPRAIPLACAGGVLIAVAAAASALRPVGLASGPPYDGRSTVYLAAAAAAFAFYLAGLATVRRRAVRIGAVCAAAAAIQLAPLAGPLFFSHDVYSYWAYGRIAALHDADPYAVAPSAFPHDAATLVVAHGWLHERSVYGPAFTLLSAALARVTGPSPSAAQLVYRVTRGCGRPGARRPGSAARRCVCGRVRGLEPVARAPVRGRRPQRRADDGAGRCRARARRAPAARGRRRLGGGDRAEVDPARAAAAAPARRASRPAGARRRGARGGGRLRAHRVGRVRDELAGGVRPARPPGAHRDEHEHRAQARSLPERRPGTRPAILVGGYAWLLRTAWRGRARIALAAGLLVLTTPWLLPWYVVWTVPLAAVENDRTARVLALGLCAYLLPAAADLVRLWRLGLGNSVTRPRSARSRPSRAARRLRSVKALSGAVVLARQRVMCSTASSPSTRRTTRPRMSTCSYGSPGGETDSATARALGHRPLLDPADRRVDEHVRAVGVHPER